MFATGPDEKTFNVRFKTKLPLMVNVYNPNWIIKYHYIISLDNTGLIPAQTEKIGNAIDKHSASGPVLMSLCNIVHHIALMQNAFKLSQREIVIVSILF
jgi:hypothetical protein